MGAGIPLISSTRYEQLGFTSGLATLLTTGATHVKGAYATIGTTTFEYDAFILELQSKANSSSRRYRIDVAINTGGSDQIIVEDWVIAVGVSGKVQNTYIPVTIPKGAVVKARAQTAASADNVRVGICGVQGTGRLAKGFRAVRSLTDFAASSEDPANTFTLPASSTTLTSWAQVVASSACRIGGIYAMVDGMFAAASSKPFMLEIGWGAAAAERSLLRLLNGTASTATNTESISNIMGPFPCDFPAATRFAVRAQASSTIATAALAVVMHGLQP